MAQSRLYNPFVNVGGGGGGEANTGANVGTGDGVFKDKSGVTLNFKSLVAGSGITLTPSANEIEIEATAGGVTENVEQITLDAGHIAAKEVTLANAPLVAANVKLNIVGGIRQQYGVDFVVSGSDLSWNSLGLDGLLEVGDILIVDYLS